MDRKVWLWASVVLLGGCPGPSDPRDAGRGDTGALDAPRDASTSDAPPNDAPVASCGNGAVEGTEECDGVDLAGETCSSQGFDTGTLACGSDCTLDKTGCERTCGNGDIDSGEDCDGTNLNGGSCVTAGFASGTLACNGDCSYNTTACLSCGNGVVDSGEGCDGSAFGTATCVTLGFTGGALACTSTCSVDTSGCTDTLCGNGAVDAGEDCDGAALGGRNCTNFGFGSGTLSCNPSCTANTSMCSSCGNGVVNGSESCDGTALGGHTCASEGYTSGTLRCTATCVLDPTMCVNSACGNGTIESGEVCDDSNGASGDGCSATCVIETGYACTGTPSNCDPVCGDGMIAGAETCDGSNLAGRTCTSLGFAGGGTLACSATCAFNVSGCSSGTCGNGTLNSGEECDDGNTVGFDGCSATCTVDPTYDLPVRLAGGAGSNIGRIEVWQTGMWRDVCDDLHDVPTTPHTNVLANVVCRQLGYTGTGHRVIPLFGGGSATPIMDNVTCTGSEPNLSQCTFNGWGAENCVGTEALGVECMPGEGDVRLVGGAHGADGRLQIYHASAWGEVCDDIIDFPTTGYGADTVCAQLGYASGTIYDTTAPGSNYVLDDVSCTGTERRIADCSHAAYGTHNCFDFEGVGVRCAVYAEGDNRVVGGGGRNTGRIEVLHSSIWTTVCDDVIQFGGTPATNFVRTACSNMGFPGLGTVTTDVPEGVDPILLDDVMCRATDARLLVCPALPLFSHNCSHIEDVGVVCTP